MLLSRKEDKAFFVFGFPKREQGNIREDEEIQFKKMARQVLALTDEHLQRLIENGQFEEVVKDA